MRKVLFLFNLSRQKHKILLLHIAKGSEIFFTAFFMEYSPAIEARRGLNTKNCNLFKRIYGVFFISIQLE